MAKAAKKKGVAKKAAGKKGSGKRELIEPKGGKRYVRRDNKGQFSESDDQSKSLSQDKRKKAATKSKPGYGDTGDRSS